MAIQRGVTRFKHTRARNFVQDVAQKRLDATVPALNRKSMNSLDVNAVEMIVYNKISDGPPCTCEETEIKPEMMTNSNVPPIVEKQGTKDVGIKIDRTTNLFGETGEAFMTEHEETEYDDRVQDIMGADDDITRMVDNVFAGHNEDCGICYRRGTVPGYSPLMWQRELLTTHSMVNSQGFWVDTRTAPHTFERQDPSGFVEFVVVVPKYLKRCLFSVRNNREILGEPIYSGSGLELTRADLDAARGRPLTVRIHAEKWTHAVIEFDQGIRINGNISEVTQAKDYTMLESFSALTVILPPTVAKLDTSDVLVLPRLRKVLKISDVTHKRTAKLRKYAEWSVQTRILQPQEALRYIHDGTEL
jgi:hypothetical protein